MCGILTFIAKNGKCIKQEFQEFNEPDLDGSISSINNASMFNQLIPYIVQRGPDYASLRSIPELNALLFSSVLSLRQPFTKQSVEVDGRYILQYNGELYNESEFSNDTCFIASLLREHSVVETVCRLEGEFAYSVIDLLEEKVYFGRDSIGKRS